MSYNAYCAISKEGDNDISTVRPRGVVPLLPLCSQIDVGATVNSLLGDTFSRENNTHGSRFHDRDPQFASRILGAMTPSCYIGTRHIRSRVIRGPYCTYFKDETFSLIFESLYLARESWFWIEPWFFAQPYTVLPPVDMTSVSMCSMKSGDRLTARTRMDVLLFFTPWPWTIDNVLLCCYRKEPTPATETGGAEREWKDSHGVILFFFG